MEKFQLYRTALDALQFLIVSELGFEKEDLQLLNGLHRLVSDMMNEAVYNVVSDKKAKLVK